MENPSHPVLYFTFITFFITFITFLCLFLPFLSDLCYFFDMWTYIISSFITTTVSKQAFSSHIWDSKYRHFCCDWLSFTHLLFRQKKCVIGFWYSLKWYLNWQVVNDWFTNLWAEEVIATYPLLPAITFYKFVIRFVR